MLFGPLANCFEHSSILKVGDLARRFDSIPAGAWPKPPHEAVIAPMAQQGQRRPAGFLVAGINPYRRLDEPYLRLYQSRCRTDRSGARQRASL